MIVPLGGAKKCTLLPCWNQLSQGSTGEGPLLLSLKFSTPGEMETVEHAGDNSEKMTVTRRCAKLQGLPSPEESSKWNKLDPWKTILRKGDLLSFRDCWREGKF